VSADSIAICAVSRSRISPTMITSGSARTIARRPVELLDGRVSLSVRWGRLEIGPAVGLGHAEVGEQERDRLWAHRDAAVGVHGQLAGLDLLLTGGLGDQRLGEVRALALLDGPADDVADVVGPGAIRWSKRTRTCSRFAQLPPTGS
jgi:hypothetical protein